MFDLLQEFPKPVDAFLVSTASARQNELIRNSRKNQTLRGDNKGARVFYCLTDDQEMDEREITTTLTRVTSGFAYGNNDTAFVPVTILAKSADIKTAVVNGLDIEKQYIIVIFGDE